MNSSLEWKVQSREMHFQDLEGGFISYLSGGFGFTNSTIRNRRENYHKIAEYFKSVNTLSLEKVREYYTHLKATYKINTVNQRIATLRYIFDYFIELGICTENHAKTLKLKTPPKRYNVDTLSPEELESLVECDMPYTNSTLHDNYSILYQVLAETGMRISEVTSLQVKHLDTSNNIIRLEDTKSNEPRLIPINRNLREKLIDHCKGKTQNDFVITNTRGTEMDHSEIRKDLNRRCKKLGITKKVTPHTFRHTFATTMLANGSPLPQVQAILGHASIQTTERYIHLEIKALHEALNRYHPLIKKHRTKNQIIEDVESSVIASVDLSDSRISHKIIKDDQSIKLEIYVS